MKVRQSRGTKLKKRNVSMVEVAQKVGEAMKKETKNIN